MHIPNSTDPQLSIHMEMDLDDLNARLASNNIPITSPVLNSAAAPKPQGPSTPSASDARTLRRLARTNPRPPPIDEMETSSVESVDGSTASTDEAQLDHTTEQLQSLDINTARPKERRQSHEGFSSRRMIGAPGSPTVNAFSRTSEQMQPSDTNRPKRLRNLTRTITLRPSCSSTYPKDPTLEYFGIRHCLDPDPNHICRPTSIDNANPGTTSFKYGMYKTNPKYKSPPRADQLYKRRAVELKEPMDLETMYDLGLRHLPPGEAFWNRAIMKFCRERRKRREKDAQIPKMVRPERRIEKESEEVLRVEVSLRGREEKEEGGWGGGWGSGGRRDKGESGNGNGNEDGESLGDYEDVIISPSD